jgi:hypothetical protein
MQKTLNPHTQPDHKNGHNQEPSVSPKQIGEFAGITATPGEQAATSGNRNIEAQAMHLIGERLQSTQRHSLARQIGHVYGNRHLHDIVTFVQRQSSIVDAPPSSIQRPALSELRTIANSAINAEYYGAARDALVDFENVMAPDFDWGAFWVNLAGNAIWATACFATGGTAFMISVSGIALAAGATAESAPTRSDFHQQTVDGIDGEIIQPLLNRIDPITRDVDMAAIQGNWDDNQTRRELLGRLVQPEYIMIARGGLPVINRQAIRTRIRNDLIIMANAARPNVRGLQWDGQFVYYYEVTNHVDEGGLLEAHFSDQLKPPDQWRFRLRQVALELPAGGENAVRALQAGGVLHPAQMAFRKRISIQSGSWDRIAVTTNESNHFNGIGEHLGIFRQVWPPHPMRLGSHYALGTDPAATGQAIIRNVWSASNGLPPDVNNVVPFSSYWL